MMTNVIKISLVLVTVIIIWMVYPADDEIVQPIDYNHKVHIEEAGAECADCHIYVEKMSSATLPSLEICQDCHEDEPMSDSPEEVRLLKYIEKELEIPWERIYKVPEHVYFSHRRHVLLGELECSNCHGNVAELSVPVDEPFLPVTMDNCIDCHKQHKVSNDCLSCHR